MILLGRWRGAAAAVAAGVMASAAPAVRGQDLDRIAPRLPGDEPASVPLAVPDADLGPVGRASPGETDGTGPADIVLAGLVRRVRLVALESIAGSGVGPEGGPAAAAAGGVVFDGVEPPRRRRLGRVLERWLGRPLTVADVDALTRAVVDHYERAGRPVVEVWVPDQDPDAAGGELVVGVADGRAGRVGIEAGRYFDGGLLEKRLRIAPGDVLTDRAIEHQRAALGGNPFRTVELYVSPGAAPGEADLLFQIDDRRPFRLYAGYENTGVEPAGEDRWFTGFNWGNVLGRDHQLSYQFTMGDRYDQFAGHSLIYDAPLPGAGHRLVAEAAYAEAEAETDLGAGAAALVASGESWQAGLRYALPAPGFLGARHRFTIGPVVKQARDSISLGGGAMVAQAATLIAQLELTHAAERTDPLGVTGWRAKAVWSPGGLGGDNSDAAFAGLRPGAESRYAYVSLGASRLQRLPWDFSLLGRADAQWSDGALLPSEQVWLGGFGSVRGYREREYLGDSGAVASLELRTPVVSVPVPLPVPEKAGSESEPEAGIQLLGFVDYGRADFEGVGAAEISSAGAGLRCQVGRSVELRFDYGWALDASSSRAHLGFVVAW